MKKLITGISLILLSSILGQIEDRHALYISVVDIEINSLRPPSISFKIFKDDLSDAVYNFNQNRFNEDDIRNKSYQEAIQQYLRHVFLLKGDQKEIQIGFDTFVIEGDAVFVLGTFNFDSDVDKIGIESALLTELFPTQSNMIHIQWFGKDFFQKLDRKKQKIEIN